MCANGIKDDFYRLFNFDLFSLFGKITIIYNGLIKVTHVTYIKSFT